MKEAADRLAALCELVVTLNGSWRVLDVHRDAVLVEEFQRRGGCPQPALVTAAQHHGDGAVLKELLDVRGLDPVVVVRSGLAPVPLGGRRPATA
jgi:hypothetical protein